MNEIRSLTGLRGIAALTVFLAHLRANLVEYGIQFDLPEWFNRLFLEGGRQVDLFFVLSGFIMALTYKSWFTSELTWNGAWLFWRRRFARIYPLHAVMLVVVACAVLAAGHLKISTTNGLDRFNFSELIPYFLLIQAWGVWIDGPGNWNPAAWSVSIEVMAYLLFPVWLHYQIKRSDRYPLGFFLFYVIVGFVLNYYLSWGLAGWSGIARGLSEFGLGAVLVSLVDRPIPKWLGTNPGAICAIFILGASYLLFDHAVFLIAVAGAIFIMASYRDNVISRFLSKTPFFFLGEISYSIYLGHFLFGSIAIRLIKPTWMIESPFNLTVGLIGIVAFVLIGSTISYYAIEKPGRSFLRRNTSK